jgi:hypothetical protein
MSSPIGKLGEFSRFRDIDSHLLDFVARCAPESLGVVPLSRLEWILRSRVARSLLADPGGPMARALQTLTWRDPCIRRRRRRRVTPLTRQRLTQSASK